jgi:hypothetical protein
VDADALHVTKAVAHAARALRRGRRCDRVPGRRPGRGRLDLAGRGAGPAALLARGGRVRGRPAPRDRRRRGSRRAGSRPCRGHGLVRGSRSGRRSRVDDPDRRRIRGDAAPARVDLGSPGQHGRGGRGRRLRRRERRHRHHRAACPPRHPGRSGAERLRRPDPAAAGSSAFDCARAGAGGVARTGAGAAACRGRAGPRHRGDRAGRRGCPGRGRRGRAGCGRAGCGRAGAAHGRATRHHRCRTCTQRAAGGRSTRSVGSRPRRATAPSERAGEGNATPERPSGAESPRLCSVASLRRAERAAEAANRQSAGAGPPTCAPCRAARRDQARRRAGAPPGAHLGRWRPRRSAVASARRGCCGRRDRGPGHPEGCAYHGQR